MDGQEALNKFLIENRKGAIIGIIIIIAIALAFTLVQLNNDADAKKKANYVTANNLYSTDVKRFDNEFKSRTEIQQAEWWASVKGRTVEWTGKVVDVTNDSIVVSDNAFNVPDFVAKIADKSALPNVHKDATIKIRGTVSVSAKNMPYSLTNAVIMK